MNNELHEFIDKFNLIERTYKNAKEAIKNYIKEEPEDAFKNGILSPESVQYYLSACCYVITNYGDEAERDYIQIDIDFFNNKGNCVLGYYYMLYNCNDGEEFDDTLVIN